MGLLNTTSCSYSVFCMQLEMNSFSVFTQIAIVLNEILLELDEGMPFEGQGHDIKIALEVN